MSALRLPVIINCYKIIIALLLLAACAGAPGVSAQMQSFPARAEVIVEGKFRGAEGIAFNGEGRLFVTADDALWEVTRGGAVRRVADLQSSVGLAPIGKRDLIVADFGPTNAINHGPNKDGLVLRITPEGKKTVLAAGIADPNFVLLRKDGSLLVSDDFTRDIWEVTLKTGKVTLFSNAIAHPNGMALSSDGRSLFVAQIFRNFRKDVRPIECDNRVWRLPLRNGRPNGLPVVLFQSSGIGCNDGLAMDSKGRLYVAANREGRIWRVDPADGSALLVAEQSAASIAFGEGDFDRTSIYVTELRGGRILKIPVGAKGARLHRQ
ncbi:MAG TPA: SMP-30/gluconolactonase/LRE family protein [Pyrinomonadaceae bacterium]|nr:SMP-30/gluconolactonase/LRE family protein [Pyrinomonadaceae bacterium]